jgi:hypothetical protein
MLFAELEDNFEKKVVDNVLKTDIPGVHPLVHINVFLPSFPLLPPMM